MLLEVNQENCYSCYYNKEIKNEVIFVMNYLKKFNRPLKNENIIDVFRNFFSLNNLNNVINQAST